MSVYQKERQRDRETEREVAVVGMRRTTKTCETFKTSKTLTQY